MDLALYTRVLWRYRFVLVAGVVLGVILALLSYYRVEMGVVPKLTPRKAEVWQSSASVILTQGRSQVVPVPGVSDPRSLAGLAGLYARLATSDAVLSRVPSAVRAGGVLEATPSIDRSSESPLPVISFFGKGATPRIAQTTVSQGVSAFLGYVRAQQGSLGIPKRSQVELQILNDTRPALLIEPRKKTLPIVVFLSVLITAIASAFILENRRLLAPATESSLASEAEVELRPARHEEVELRPARQEADLRSASATPVASGPSPKSEDESEPEPASAVRRWA